MTLREQTGRAHRAAGFSLIETLIAALLLLIITLGILPLFTNAMRSNEAGREYTQVTNYARSRAEELFQLPMTATALTLTAGTSKVTSEYYSKKDKVWKTGTLASVPSGDTALWLRTSTIRQYNIADLNTPLAATAPAESVHVKEIEVAVTGTRTSNTLGPTKSLTVRLLKSQ
jgi:type II secretory pathway pseudopilin PulG